MSRTSTTVDAHPARVRSAVVLSLVACVGFTQLSEADDSAVAAAKRGVRAAFAKDAGAVNGIKTSRTPRPGRLVAFDRQGKLPESVVPTGIGGPGAQGGQGAGRALRRGTQELPRPGHRACSPTWSPS